MKKKIEKHSRERRQLNQDAEVGMRLGRAFEELKESLYGKTEQEKGKWQNMRLGGEAGAR